jgi:4-amino-4-deoxy-L-arabinose transferase-like glycosyltransferase
VKVYKVEKNDLFAIGIIFCAAVLRFVLVALGWPPTNSDEGTMGVMALDIVYHGAHPVVYYGQYYMGSIEAYLGAAFFHLFGPSLFTLRLGVILMVSLFLLNMYLLTCLLYTKIFALLVLILLSCGSNFIFTLEIYAKGGTPETLFFGSLAFLIASWLALSCKRDLFGKQRKLRLVGYAVWGIAVGLGIWSDMIVLPIFFVAGLLLLIFCWSDIRRVWAIVCLLLGLLVGLFPLITYNLAVPPQQNSLSTFLGLFHGGKVQQAHTLAQTLSGIINMLSISLPLATGDPSCPIAAIHYGGGDIHQSPSCMVLHTLWGLGYVILWLLAVFLTVKTLWQLRSRDTQRSLSARIFARLFLLAGAGIAASAYAVSSAPHSLSQAHARYLMTLLIVTPAILWPLWNGLRKTRGKEKARSDGELEGNSRARGNSTGETAARDKARGNSIGETAARDRARGNSIGETAARDRAMASGGRAMASIAPTLVLIIVVGAFLVGTVFTLGDVPAAQVVDRQQETLIHWLLLTDTTHIYTEYWTCNRIAFMSQERIICGVLDNNLRPTHNRDTGFYSIVSGDPHAAYVFPSDSPQRRSIEKKLAQAGTINQYAQFTVAGYVIYKPMVLLL